MEVAARAVLARRCWRLTWRLDLHGAPDFFNLPVWGLVIDLKAWYGFQDKLAGSRVPVPQSSKESILWIDPVLGMLRRGKRGTASSRCERTLLLQRHSIIYLSDVDR